MLSVVVPTYRRAGVLTEVHHLLQACLDMTPMDYEIIWVDDASGDGTAEVLLSLAQRDPRVKVVLLERNAGQQNATLAGIRMAEGSLILTMDDDLRYSPDSIISMIKELSKGYDVVYGVPPRQDNGRIRHMGTELKEWVFRILCGKPKAVTLTSYRIMTRDLADWVIEDTVSKVYISARILQKTRRIGVIPVSDETGRHLPSNYTIIKLTHVMWQVFRNYTAIGITLGMRHKGPQYVLKE